MLSYKPNKKVEFQDCPGWWSDPIRSIRCPNHKNPSLVSIFSTHWKHLGEKEVRCPVYVKRMHAQRFIVHILQILHITYTLHAWKWRKVELSKWNGIFSFNWRAICLIERVQDIFWIYFLHGRCTFLSLLSIYFYTFYICTWAFVAWDRK